MSIISLARYADGKVRIVGGKLDGLETLNWVRDRNHEIQLVWMDETGDLNVEGVVGRICVKGAELEALDPAIAQRAAISNCEPDRLENKLEELATTRKLAIEYYYWLGIKRCREIKNTANDMSLPKWALGYEIVEEHETFGCFAPICYFNQDLPELRFVKKHYCTLLVNQFNTKIGKYTTPFPNL